MSTAEPTVAATNKGGHTTAGKTMVEPTCAAMTMGRRLGRRESSRQWLRPTSPELTPELTLVEMITANLKAAAMITAATYGGCDQGGDYSDPGYDEGGVQDGITA